MADSTDQSRTRLSADISRSEARRLKAKLALRGETFATWLRRKIAEFLEERP